MRRRHLTSLRAFLLLLAVGAGCNKPYVRFDEGYDVHFILVPQAEGKPVRMQPVCTVADEVRRLSARTISGAAEVAIIHVPAGDHRASVWDKKTRSGGRTSLDVDHDIWLVMTVIPGDRDASIEVLDMPPRDRAWTPLVADPR